MRIIPTPSPVSETCTIMGIRPRTRSGSSWLNLESTASTTNRGPTIARVLLAYLVVSLGYLTSVGAVNLRQCGIRLQGLQEGAWNATNSTSPAPLLHLSYGECLTECGGGTGDVNWDAFSQSFGAWFLPWIALMFQIPFGAECT